MTAKPEIIFEMNLSNAWRETMDRIIKLPGHEIAPLVLTLTDFTESAKIRSVLDESLKKDGKASIQTVAETIFPDSLYQYFGQDRKVLYREYKAILSRIHDIDKRNKRGTYFERLIAYDGKINQLEIIISSYFQASGFNF